MKKIVLTMFLSALMVLGANAQDCCKTDKGDWYVGAGDVANTAWTEWAVSPTVGYGLTNNLMIGLNISQVDSTVDMEFDIHARYFMKGYFAYASTNGLNADGMKLGLGKMFMLCKNVYIDPKVVYNTTEKTTNLGLGFGFKF